MSPVVTLSTCAEMKAPITELHSLKTKERGLSRKRGAKFDLKKLHLPRSIGIFSGENASFREGKLCCNKNTTLNPEKSEASQEIEESSLEISKFLQLFVGC